MNRTLQQALALILLCGMLFSLAACGAPAPAEAQSSAPAPATEETASSWWNPAPRQDSKAPADETSAVTARPTVFLPLSINEVMLSNKATLPDSQGLFPDWVELYNYGGDTLSLGGLALCRGEGPCPTGSWSRAAIWSFSATAAVPMSCTRALPSPKTAST